MLDALRGWGDSHDSFEVGDAKARGEDSWSAVLKSRAEGASIKADKKKGDPRVVVSTLVEVPEDSRVAAAELGEGAWSLGQTVEAVQYGHAPTLQCDLDDNAGGVTVTMVIYEDGFNRHTLNEAVMEVAKVQRALLNRFRSVIEARDLKRQAERDAADYERRFQELIAQVDEKTAEQATTGASGTSVTAPMEEAKPQVVAQTVPAWVPTHLVPAGGMRSWPEPNPAAGDGPSLDGGLELQIVERRGDWARVAASNGWTGWVDGRLLTSR